MFSAPKGLQNRMYGAHILLDALQRLPKQYKDRLVLLYTGTEQGGVPESIPVQAIALPMAGNPLRWASFAAAADVYAYPAPVSIPKGSYLQAMACATPVLAF